MADCSLSGRTLGEFILREQIGEGGYGAVYRGEQPLLGRDVVIKMLRERRRDSLSRGRFLREARLASRLDHPYAAHVYAFGAEEDGLLWIAMERVQGIPLDAWLETRGPMPPEQFVPFFECIAEVVHAAHLRGIVHRDLKPSNIMVIEGGGRLLPKLLDFGIAKVNSEAAALASAQDGSRAGDAAPEPDPEDMETARLLRRPPRAQRTITYPDLDSPDLDSKRRLTRSDVCLGSRPYMAPEQWRSPESVCPAADLYSLGVVAFQALTGRLPFTADSTGDYRRQHCDASPPRLLWPEIDDVLQAALAKCPGDRQSSVLELASQLRRALPASKREQLRFSAQQWADQDRPPGLLWGPDVLANATRQLPLEMLGELECSFVAEGLRRAQRVRWARRALVVLAAAAVLGGLQYRSAMQAHLAEQQARLAEQKTRAARELAEARTTESELEQGRAALLHGEPEAVSHLTEAYKRDPSPTTAFMLARAVQPRLAEQARFASTYGRMWWATFSPDGRQIATTDDRAARIWDAKTHALRFTLPHGCEVYQAEYSPDGKWLVTAAETTVRIWDAASGALVRDLRAKPRGRAALDYYRAAISPDGRLVAAMDAAGSVVHVWDAANGALVAELPSRAAQFPRLAFSAGGWLATTGGGEVSVFDVRTWRHVASIPGPVHSLAFDAHSRLVTGAPTGDVALWSIPGGARLRHLRPSGEPVDAVAFSPDGQLVAAGSRGGAMQVWQASSGALRSQLNPRHSKILGVEFDPTSRLFLAANADGTVVVADAAQGLPVAILEGPRNIVRVARFGPGSQVVGASWDGTARVWDGTSPYRRWTSEPVSNGCGISMRSQAARRFVAVSCGDSPTRVWDTAHDRLLAELPSVTAIDGGGFTSAFPVVSSAGDRAAIARGDTVEVYELPGGRFVRTIAHRAPVSAVAFASAGRDLVSGAVDGSVLVTREDGGQHALQASAGIDVVELLPDGRVIVSDAERRLRIHAPDGAVLADLETLARIISLQRDGTRVVALPSYTGNATPPVLIDLERYRVVAQLEGHVGQVFSARWVTEQRLITAGADGAARLWDGTTGRLLQTYRGSPRFLADATLASDGLVIAGDADGLLRFWDAASGAKLWMLEAHKSAVIRVHVEGGDIVTRGFTGEISRWRLPKPEQVLNACARHSHCAIGPAMGLRRDDHRTPDPMNKFRMATHQPDEGK